MHCGAHAGAPRLLVALHQQRPRSKFMQAEQVQADLRSGRKPR
jgi:hypothetical protein